MPSSRNRKQRRLQLGANRKLTVTRWTNGMTGRVVLSRITRGRANECDNNGKVLPFGFTELAGGNVQPTSFRSSEEKASEGAEKSCLPKRRGRGLRSVGKRRRGGKPRAKSPSVPAPGPKRGHERRVNHSGRKFIWAARAGNRLANLRTARRLIGALPRMSQEAQDLISGRVFQRELIDSPSVKAYTGFKRSWRGVKRRADALSIPAIAAVHSSPWKFLSVRSSIGDWDLLLAALRPPEDGEPKFANSGLGHYWLTTRRGFLCSRCGRLLDMNVGPCVGRGGGGGKKTPPSGRGRGSRKGSNPFASLF